ncbi:MULTISPECIES: type 1 glutamine amidotransferase domain-containing protein [unclassified Salinibacterium]|uniref:type 1 glutamine amidotransferase domain-containing protein n=1 Tax=unclassified Salinibacterium TaxID=2632331 RepID=UPI0018CEF524|nr:MULTISPECIES: type 1 glutamine amidotransferase domain-containing protein [unclassified Salinibacterium]MBH0055005.1 type 1 glutamine amidotransferase domain-containing protein [Salinibacterium sp. SWN139]MBH0083853.1 type 1 glutamine amidotransferase domain-containing protein [Salinibacterium sp. SWN167]
MTNVLMVLSAASYLTLADETQHPTGVWAEEFLEPYRIFTEAGWKVQVASPAGVAPTFDAISLSEGGVGSAERLADFEARIAELQPVLQHPLRLDAVNASDYDVIFYPGGHGPMEDLAVDDNSGQLIVEAVKSNTTLGVLCHAPAALLAANDKATGEWALKGRKMTGFANTEEELGGLADKVKWLVETRLVELGADYSKAAEPFAPYVVVDGALYTGQNPASSVAVAERIVADKS